MVKHTIERLTERLLGAAQLFLDPARPIDKFLDWIEEFGGMIALEAARADGPANSEARELTAAS